MAAGAKSQEAPLVELPGRSVERFRCWLQSHDRGLTPHHWREHDCGRGVVDREMVRSRSTSALAHRR